MATLTTTLTLDLHVHTNYSHDGHDSVEKIIKSAKAKKLDGIAICDHDTMEGSYAARKYVADNNLDLIIIPGIEVTTSNGHLIVLGLEEGIEKGLSPEETIKIAREEEKKGTVVVIAPHPFHPFRHSIGRLCMHPELDIDAIEIFNSRYFFGAANEIARRKTARKNITAVVGSDAHSAECVGLATAEVGVEVEVETEAEQKTEQKMHVQVEAILRGIKDGKVRIKSSKRTPFWVYFKQLL